MRDLSGKRARHVFNPSTRIAKVSKSEASLVYIVKFCLRKEEGEEDIKRRVERLVLLLRQGI